MEMLGEARLGASRELVWEALNDPEVLRASIPGCETLEKAEDGSLTATVVSKVGPIKARFAGKVTLSNIVPPRSYTLTGEGSGGAAGFAKADIGVNLDALDANLTLLRYSVKANVGGKLAQLGSRMVDAAARKSADDFFELFGKQVTSRAADGSSAASPAGLDLAALGGVDQQETADAAATAYAPTSAAAPAPVAATPVVAAQTDASVQTSDAGREAVPPAVVAASPAKPASVSAASTAAAMDVLTAELIKVWISDQIAVVTLNRPGSRNAMTYAMWQAIPIIFGALARNPEVRAIILTGAGEDFCAGADIAEFEAVRGNAAQATEYEVAVDGCCDAIANVSKPTIAVLKGYCLGGGAHLAMSCDFRYASTNAVFGIPAARLSIIYGVKGTRKLLNLVGLPEAKKILFGAQRFTADRALQIGFVDHVATGGSVSARSWLDRLIGGGRKGEADVGDPMADARVFAQSLAGNAPLTICGAKALLNGMAMGTGALDLVHAEALITAAAASDDYREGRAAFGEKRAPQFKGR
ncbi:enoyl-CoA hydratase-related protein [Pseudorhodoferax soli]|uniref:Enoyl-CoA hydratase/carnithine racemase n=1 Tax=Pseudorhodoferax soli TaxID=545864 RepID=A0A368XLU3_9BURK|nr:enoyl-CoA hydratase-related protein [Pseudorhodoferax soli]RCW68529.1 enoyl-CoA hydratase/carnithine racemase [Pseudorhodoferax soli]